MTTPSRAPRWNISPPAIPVDAPSLVFAAAGVVVGFIIWDMAGWPVRRASAKRAAAKR